MSRERDPLGKRALFSGAENGVPAPAGAEQASAQPELPTGAPAPALRKPGPLDVIVMCSSCNVRSTVSAPEIALKHLPVVAWLPWRKQSLLMRCPACNKLAWHAVGRR